MSLWERQSIMEGPYVRRSILRLPGLTKADYFPVEDVADMRLLQGVGNPLEGPEEPAPESVHPPDKIPRTFDGNVAHWLYGTNLRCWQCDFAFDGPPKFAPTHVREAENGGIEFGVLGNMCTFNCAALWIAINYAGQTDQLWRMQDNLCLVYFLFTGHHVARIPPAPHKIELRRYGGELEEDAFSTKLRSLDTTVAGLRDHTPGSIVPERNRTPAVPECDRIKTAVVAVRASAGLSGAPVLRAIAAGGDTLGSRPSRAGEPLTVGQKSVWKVCGLREEESPYTLATAAFPGCEPCCGDGAAFPGCDDGNAALPPGDDSVVCEPCCGDGNAALPLDDGNADLPLDDAEEFFKLFGLMLS